MAARADILGDTGANDPEHWVGGLAGDDLHAIAILFARDDERAPPVHRRTRQAASPAATACAVLSYLDLNATPPFNYAHDHFGFRDRLSQPVIKGSGEEPTPGSGAPLKPGEFILGYPDEDGPVAESAPAGGACRATAATWPTAGCRSTSARSATTCASNAETPEEQELLAAKFMGRWRSGAPLVLAPGRRRSRARRGPDAQQRLQLQGDGPVRLRRARSARTPAG